MELSNFNDFQLGLMKTGLKNQISECASHPAKTASDILELTSELAKVEWEESLRNGTQPHEEFDSISDVYYRLNPGDVVKVVKEEPGVVINAPVGSEGVVTGISGDDWELTHFPDTWIAVTFEIPKDSEYYTAIGDREWERDFIPRYLLQATHLFY